MWLFTLIDFFSAVREPGHTRPTGRARVAEDLDALCERYASSLSPTVAHAGTDCAYRAMIEPAEWTAAVSRIALDVDYPSFKDEVARRQGAGCARVYGKVRSALRGLESPNGRR